MPRRPLLCLLFAAALAPVALVAPVAPGQDDAKTKPITIRTVDEASLKGVLHLSEKGPNSPSVILLHQYLADPDAGGLRDLAKELAAKGFNVLKFGFRGHGDSTLINPNRFWNDPINAAYMPKLARKKVLPDKLELTDLKNPQIVHKGYYPKLADDLMAARVTLDKLNDNSEVNTSSVYLIGCGDAVNLGFLYIAAEWSRTQKLPPYLLSNQYPALTPARGGRLGAGDNPAGLDVAGAVWLSPARNPAVSDRDLQTWVQYAPEMRERTPMLFLHGDGDPAGASVSKFFKNQVLAARVGNAPLPALKLTEVRAVKKTPLTGVKLLGSGQETTKLITDYLRTLEDERKNLLRVGNRGFSTPPPIDLPEFGVCRPPRGNRFDE